MAANRLDIPEPQRPKQPTNNPIWKQMTLYEWAEALFLMDKGASPADIVYSYEQKRRINKLMRNLIIDYFLKPITVDIGGKEIEIPVFSPAEN